VHVLVFYPLLHSTRYSAVLFISISERDFIAAVNVLSNSFY